MLVGRRQHLWRPRRRSLCERFLPKQQEEWTQLVSTKTGKPIATVSADDPGGFALGLGYKILGPLGAQWFLNDSMSTYLLASDIVPRARLARLCANYGHCTNKGRHEGRPFGISAPCLREQRPSILPVTKRPLPRSASTPQLNGDCAESCSPLVRTHYGGQVVMVGGFNEGTHQMG